MKKIITDKKVLKDFLKYESKKYGLKSSNYPFIALSENRLLYRYNYLMRKLEYYTNCNKRIRKIFTKLYYLRWQRKHSIFLPINSFDKGLKLIHIGPRLVNGKANIGKDLILHINTCIVAGGVNDYAPTIGDNCIISVGSIIVGKAKIGDNVVVGAGAVVNKDFSGGNMTIAGVPAKKISEKKPEDWNEEKRQIISKNN